MAKQKECFEYERATGKKIIIIIIDYNNNNRLINKYHNIDTWYTLKWSIVQDYMQMLVPFGFRNEKWKKTRQNHQEFRSVRAQLNTFSIRTQRKKEVKRAFSSPIFQIIWLSKSRIIPILDRLFAINWKLTVSHILEWNPFLTTIAESQHIARSMHDSNLFICWINVFRCFSLSFLPSLQATIASNSIKLLLSKFENNFRSVYYKILMDVLTEMQHNMAIATATANTKYSIQYSDGFWHSLTSSAYIKWNVAE